MASERRSSSVTDALFASFVETLPIPVSLAVGSDRFKYFNNAIASSAKASSAKIHAAACTRSCTSHVQWAWFTLHKVCV